ncbi:MAG: dodecin family protein, partial [Candidatus Hodarchaeota archaeon]
WEAAVQQAVDTASKTLRDLRIVTVDELDCKIENGKIVAYRARVRLSFKYED